VSDPDHVRDEQRLIEKLERTLGLIVLLHAKVADLLLTIDGDEADAASQSVDLLRRSKDVLRKVE